MADLPPLEQTRSRQVYLALCLQGSGVAMTKLQNVEAHNGLEAWRQLVLEFEPRTAGRRRLHLTSPVCPAKTNNMEKLGDAVGARGPRLRGGVQAWLGRGDEDRSPCVPCVQKTLHYQMKV
eukprot:2357692-Amphidinium_carterae.1